jgi:uncharacterized integral membrane protein
MSSNDPTRTDEMAAHPSASGGRVPEEPQHGRSPSRIGSTWTSVAIALLLLLLLIIFILQNTRNVRISFLWFDGSVALGVALLVAAVLSGVVVGLAAAARVFQLQRRVHRLRKSTSGR